MAIGVLSDRSTNSVSWTITRKAKKAVTEKAILKYEKVVDRPSVIIQED